ncbi:MULTISPECIES: glycosyltransferase family 9 protein [Shewanella]|uniref:Glycosyltransferase family 4 protein n=1 Tax=Shewanella marisflavi TaxID=260364 RepID=A0ABX5WTQ5_9GAMM|nr:MULTISPECIES: hypothetical protein [Shewanella]QDF76990.1 hypothetical protein FGA12_18480 [Shewanella marisflavi]
MSVAPKFLFVPVSCEQGIGEYMRSTIVADEIKRRWPEAQIEFVLNSHAPYAKDCPYPTHLVNDTPTKRVKEVNQLVSRLKPDLVIFDAAGRKAQLKHANRSGAKVIFVSQHRRKRARGMKLERALVTDSHWVVQPEFVIGDISRFDRLKLNLINRAEPIFTGSIFARPDESLQRQLQQKYGLQPKEYLLYSAGSGGHYLGSTLAAERFAEVAQACYQQTGMRCVMVYGPNYPKSLPQLDGVIAIEQLSSLEFINLLDGAAGAVLSGGDTLLQSIALKVPTLTVAVSKDQPKRIQRCVQRGLALSSDIDVQTMSAQAQRLLEPQTVAQLTAKMDSEADAKGLDICMAEIARLLGLAGER